MQTQYYDTCVFKMGRSVFIEDSIEENILGLYGATKWATGILIGQSSLQRDYVVHLALTPPNEKENIEDFPSGVNKKTTSDHFDKDFDEDWFVQHCHQVNRMLTGGLKILGIFVFGAPDERNRLQTKFRQVVYSVHKMISSGLPLSKLKLDDGGNEQIILQVCSATKKITCVSIDVSNSKASFHPADMKYQNFVSKWNTLHCSICLQLKFTFEKKSKNGSFYSNLKAGLLPMVSKIANSLGTVNGVLMNGMERLLNEKQKKNCEKNSALTRKDAIEVDLYITEKNVEPFVERKPKEGNILLVGTLDSQAFVQPKATVREAINAIKCDAIRNLITRCQLLCEDLDDENIQGEENESDQTVGSWTLPKRVFAPIGGGSVKVCDFIFKDEEPKDVLNRLSELLGVYVSEKDLMSGEQFSEQDTEILLIDTDFSTNQNILKDEKVVQNDSLMYRVVGAVLGVITVVVAASVNVFWSDS